MRSLVFADVRIEIFQDSTRITLGDGSIILGQPEDTDSYRETAERTGYGDDVVQMCIDHELTHVALAHFLQSPSPTLECVGKENTNGSYKASCADLALRELEETAILALQKYARAAKIDLVKLFT
jgi:hypothetical protein